jgi:hypothetical protein
MKRAATSISQPGADDSRRLTCRCSHPKAQDFQQYCESPDSPDIVLTAASVLPRLDYVSPATGPSAVSIGRADARRGA